MRNRTIKKTFLNESSEVDMTPMLDIVFIMLIFFIVTTTFVKASGIEVRTPSNISSPEEVVQKAITIKAESIDELTFNGRSILIDSVQANVESAIAKNAKLTVQVFVDNTLKTGIIVRIVDQVRLAGISQVTVSKLL